MVRRLKSKVSTTQLSTNFGQGYQWLCGRQIFYQIKIEDRKDHYKSQNKAISINQSGCPNPDSGLQKKNKKKKRKQNESTSHASSCSFAPSSCLGSSVSTRSSTLPASLASATPAPTWVDSSSTTMTTGGGTTS